MESVSYFRDKPVVLYIFYTFLDSRTFLSLKNKTDNE